MVHAIIILGTIAAFSCLIPFLKKVDHNRFNIGDRIFLDGVIYTITDTTIEASRGSFEVKGAPFFRY